MEDANLRLQFSVSATNRAPRKGETDGVNYHFLTTEDFQRLISENAFVEYEEVYPGRFYGTLKSEVSKILESGHNLILDIEVLRERLVGRATDDIDTINQRVDKAAFELTFAPQYDVNIVNDDLDKAVAKTREVIESFISK